MEPGVSGGDDGVAPIRRPAAILPGGTGRSGGEAGGPCVPRSGTAQSQNAVQEERITVLDPNRPVPSPPHGGPRGTGDVPEHSGAARPARTTADAFALPGRTAEPVAVIVLSDDPILEQGATAYLATRPEVAVLPNERQHEAEVALVIADAVTDHTLALIERVAHASEPDGVRVVLVGDLTHRQQVLRALDAGLVGAMPRKGTDFEQVLRAILQARGGALHLPADALLSMTSWLNAIERRTLEPRGLTASGLSKREIEVIRLLAEGLDTQEIAERLDYSERTVKNIVHDVLTRLKLRNRVHAVAFALRSGAL